MNKTELENLRDEIKELKEEYEKGIKEVNEILDKKKNYGYGYGMRAAFKIMIEDLEELLKWRNQV